MGVLKSGSLFLVFAVSLYPVSVLLLTNPWLQRHALYAHKIHSGFWHDVNKPESFGFAAHQVTPFNVSTPDNEVLYAWHVLPLATVAANRDALAASDPLDQTLPLQLLKSDPKARVVVNCKPCPLCNSRIASLTKQVHGNAGHVAQGWRTDTYRALSNQPHTHVFTVDYRGFGRSTGAPTEEGLIIDGRTLVNYVLFLGIPPSRIVILGQSLGTAVATSVGLSFAHPTSELLPQTAMVEKPQQLVFRSIILVAPFSSLPDLLLSYRIGGLIPVLAPLRHSPFLVRMISEYILDTWPTGLRLSAYVSAAAAVPTSKTNGAGNVHILHARDDQDIAFAQTEKLFAMATGREIEVLPLGKRDVEVQGKVKVRVEMLEYGMHNRVVTYAPVQLAVMRAFEGI
ncbi:alpha/beta-hydrolase [Aureobasidium subglaciale]|nr:alpha/beta-hydrolase [Aureobasidium subglaciale]